MSSPLYPQIILPWAHAQAYVSPEAAVLTRLFVKLLSDDLNEMAYDAELAGLSYGLHNTKQGLLLTFYGCAPAHLEPLSCALVCYEEAACARRAVGKAIKRGLRHVSAIFRWSVVAVWTLQTCTLMWRMQCCPAVFCA